MQIRSERASLKFTNANLPYRLCSYRLQVNNALRRERDSLVAELEGLRAALSKAQAERDELASKV